MFAYSLFNRHCSQDLTLDNIIYSLQFEDQPVEPAANLSDNRKLGW